MKTATGSVRDTGMKTDSILNNTEEAHSPCAFSLGMFCLIVLSSEKARILSDNPGFGVFTETVCFFYSLTFLRAMI